MTNSVLSHIESVKYNIRKPVDITSWSKVKKREKLMKISSDTEGGGTVKRTATSNTKTSKRITCFKFHLGLTFQNIVRLFGRWGSAAADFFSCLVFNCILVLFAIELSAWLVHFQLLAFLFKMKNFLA